MNAREFDPKETQLAICNVCVFFFECVCVFGKKPVI